MPISETRSERCAVRTLILQVDVSSSQLADAETAAAAKEEAQSKIVERLQKHNDALETKLVQERQEKEEISTRLNREIVELK